MNSLLMFYLTMKILIVAASYIFAKVKTKPKKQISSISVH